MSNHKSKPQDAKGNGPTGGKPVPAAAPPKPAKPSTDSPDAAAATPAAALFRRVDWLTALATTVFVFIGYFITLAPDLTLEDSGELAVASHYAGVPHPPGYPVWTIYTWLFTVLVPHANIAWRVALASAVAGAATCGLLALITSRGTSMILEGIEQFKAMDRKLENALCIVSGWVAGMLFGFNGYMWSQAVIVEVYTLSTLSLMGTIVCLMRWNHAPEQRRYLYWAFFLFGVCFTNHQTLIVAAPGIELAILLRDRKLGRELFWLNGVFFLLGLFAKAFVSPGFIGSPAVFNMFLFVGIASILVTLWFGVEGTVEGKLAVSAVYALIALFIWVSWTNAVVSEQTARLAGAGERAIAAQSAQSLALKFMTFYQFTALMVLTLVMRIAKGSEPFLRWVWDSLRPAVLALLVFTFLGASFYFYMPAASLSNPPLNWGYPRVIEGFVHALTRGQYEKTNPTTELQRWIEQLTMLKEGAMEEFTPVLLFAALIPLFFLAQMKRRERAWVIGLGTIGACLAFILMFLLNPSGDRQSRELTKVFFTFSHLLVAAFIGYGLALLVAWLANDFQNRRRAFLIAVSVMAGLALFQVIVVFGDSGLVRTMPKNIPEALWDLVTSLPAEESGYRPDRLAAALGLGWMGLLLLCALPFWRRAPVAALLAVFALMPAQAIIAHWAKNEQRGHLFGYWFGHDMFTPPYVSKKDKQLTYDPVEREQLLKAGDKLVYPEMTRDTVLFGGTDPGRFCPTYMIFSESFTPAKHKPRDPAFDRRDVYIITQNALADGTYLQYIRAHFNRSAQIDPPFLRSAIDHYTQSAQNSLMGKDSLNLKNNGQPHQTNGLERLAGTVAGLFQPIARPIDNAFTKLGDNIEKDRRIGNSWFKEEDFTGMAEFAARLSAPPQSDILSRFLFENLGKETQESLKGAATAPRTRRLLSRDLNALMENEYQAVRRAREIMPGLSDAARDLKEIKEVMAATSVTPNAQLDAELRSRNFWLKDPAGKEKLLKEMLARIQTDHDKLASELTAATRVPVLYDTNRFAGITLSHRLQRFIKEKPSGHTRIRLNRQLIEEAYPKLLAKSEGGVYPDLEIRTPSVADSQRAFNDYVEDASKRAKHDKDFPNEPRQVKPGEDIRWEGNRLSVQGQVAVMSINGLLTKMIFDANPDHDFYVEESFPLEWMYPYLTPSGIIMKINRQPLPELTDEIIQRDHEFWSQYSRRLIGNWIDYDTPVSNICAFAEKVYKRRDWSGFDGDQKFVRDDDGQKAFSKLRSAIAGVYYWRINHHAANPVAQEKMIREADFAFKQAYAFCPFSPEALFRYTNLLISRANMEASRGSWPRCQRHVDDAILLAQTFIRLDPANPSARDLLKNLNEMRKQFEAGIAGATKARLQVTKLAADQQANPTNFQNAVTLWQVYVQMGDTNKASAVLDPFLTNVTSDVTTLLNISDLYARVGNLVRRAQASQMAVQVGERILTTPNPDAASLMLLAQAYNMAFDMRHTGNIARLENVMVRFNRVAPNNAEGLYDLAAIQAALSKNNEAIASLSQALQLSDARLLVANTNRDLRSLAAEDTRFTPLGTNPAFRQLLKPR